MGRHDDDRSEHDRNDFDWRAAGAAGPFPGEREWLTLPPPPFADDFVARTLDALGRGGAAGGDGGLEVEQEGEEDSVESDFDLTKAQLATFAPDAPRADFVADTLARLDADRRHRWQEMLARYVAPEPSAQFVQRTLAALAEDRPRRSLPQQSWQQQSWPRRVAPLLPWLAAAAAVLWFVLLRDVEGPPFERRVADNVAVEYRHADSPTPLPALLAQLAHDEDRDALPTGLADGYWLAAAAATATRPEGR